MLTIKKKKRRKTLRKTVGVLFPRKRAQIHTHTPYTNVLSQRSITRHLLHFFALEKKKKAVTKRVMKDK